MFRSLWTWTSICGLDGTGDFGGDVMGAGTDAMGEVGVDCFLGDFFFFLDGDAGSGASCFFLVDAGCLLFLVLVGVGVGVGLGVEVDLGSSSLAGVSEGIAAAAVFFLELRVARVLLPEGGRGGSGVVGGGGRGTPESFSLDLGFFLGVDETDADADADVDAPDDVDDCMGIFKGESSLTSAN